MEGGGKQEKGGLWKEGGEVEGEGKAEKWESGVSGEMGKLERGGKGEKGGLWREGESGRRGEIAEIGKLEGGGKLVKGGMWKEGEKWRERGKERERCSGGK